MKRKAKTQTNSYPQYQSFWPANYKPRLEAETPPSEIIIEKDWRLRCWAIRNSSHRSIIIGENGQAFGLLEDPLTVAKALKAKAQGPINVVVNL